VTIAARRNVTDRGIVDLYLSDMERIWASLIDHPRIRNNSGKGCFPAAISSSQSRHPLAHGLLIFEELYLASLGDSP
jgi:hypothetical protein